VFCDATYVKARVKGRVVSRAVMVATGVGSTGEREVLGVEVGDSEDGAFWTGFLRGLRARGLTGVQLVISDHHLGLKAAIAGVQVDSIGSQGDNGSDAVLGKRRPPFRRQVFCDPTAPPPSKRSAARRPPSAGACRRWLASTATPPRKVSSNTPRPCTSDDPNSTTSPTPWAWTARDCRVIW
jgi:hypothetical protein